MSTSKLWLITFCLDNCQICVEGMFFKHSKTHIFLFLHDNWDEDGIFSLIQQLIDFLHMRSNLSAWKLQNRTNVRYRKILISFNSLFSLNYELVVQCAYTPKIILKKVEVLGFFCLCFWICKWQATPSLNNFLHAMSYLVSKGEIFQKIGPWEPLLPVI